VETTSLGAAVAAGIAAEIGWNLDRLLDNFDKQEEVNI